MNFEDFLRSIGLQPGTIAADNRWRRCRTELHPHRRNGAYKLASDGAIGWARDWAVHTAAVTWRPERAEAPPAFDADALRRSHQEAERRAAEATRGANEFYERCKPLRGEHPYLASHGLDSAGCFGLRVDRDGWLVVPALRNYKITSVQRISPTGEKRFWPGAPLKGGSYVIDRQFPSLTVVCEGLATGLAIFAASPLASVVVAFDSGNLARVSVPPSGMLTIAADNDWKTRCPRHKEEGLEAPYEPWESRPGWCRCNPGRCAGEAAAKAFGCDYVWPKDIRGTDWCDWRMERSAERVAKKLPRQTETGIRRDVDAEIAEAMLRAAKFRSL